MLLSGCEAGSSWLLGSAGLFSDYLVELHEALRDLSIVVVLCTFYKYNSSQFKAKYEYKKLNSCVACAC